MARLAFLLSVATPTPSNARVTLARTQEDIKRHNKAALSIMGGDTATATKKKKGLFSRFRKNKTKKGEKPLEATPPPSPQASQDDEARQSKKKSTKSVTKEGIPVITADNPDDFRASDVRKTTPGQPAVTKSKKAGKSKKKQRSPRPGSVVLDKPPTAREAAFSGPPRYDWIDVEVRFLADHCVLSFRSRPPWWHRTLDFKLNTCIHD